LDEAKIGVWASIRLTLERIKHIDALFRSFEGIVVPCETELKFILFKICREAREII
jgi:hypothetical protein